MPSGTRMKNRDLQGRKTRVDVLGVTREKYYHRPHNPRGAHRQTDFHGFGRQTRYYVPLLYINLCVKATPKAKL